MNRSSGAGADRRFRLLVFDWDGTLMDSVATIVECTRAVLAELGLAEPSEATIRGTVGLGLRETVEALCPGVDDELYGRITECYRRHWQGTYRDRPLLFPGAEAVLRELSAENFLLAIATGKSRRGLNYALDACGLAPLFHATRTADEAFSKPHPKMLLDILEDLGVRPAEALMIGDTTFDLEMARSAGTAGLAVLTGSHSRGELAELASHGCLTSIADLPAWLAGRG